MTWGWPLELLQRAGVSVRVGRGRRRQLLGLQAVGEGVEVFDQQTHHQDVLLRRAEGLLKRQTVTKCCTVPHVVRSASSFNKQPTAIHPSPKAAIQSPKSFILNSWRTEVPQILVTGWTLGDNWEFVFSQRRSQTAGSSTSGVSDSLLVGHVQKTSAIWQLAKAALTGKPTSSAGQ